MSVNISEQYRHNGRFARKRKIRWKENVLAGAKRRKLASEKNENRKIDGQRILNIARFAEDLWCELCNAPLSLRIRIRLQWSACKDLFQAA